jgi:hypothetical protein
MRRGHRGNDYAVCAYLNEESVPVLCTRKEANEWAESGGYARSQIKVDIIKGSGIETRFHRFSLAPDGPPLFWRVCWWSKAEPSECVKRWFGTKEAALEFHAVIADAVATKGYHPSTHGLSLP